MDVTRTTRPPAADPIGEPTGSASAWNVANAVTMLRLLLVPVFAVVLFRHGGEVASWRVAACVVFLVASITDRFDGELARRRGLITEFGKLADPIADKALIGTALVGLSVLGDLAWWVTIVILVRELAVTLLRFWVIRHGVLAASRGGKVKTTLQTVAIGMYLLPLSGWLHVVEAVMMGAAVVVALITGGNYVLRAMVLRRSAKAAAGTLR
jgi:CDP-diacylglycerol---glycerol-3-phosphate 3-phosphatidyltransferase